MTLFIALRWGSFPLWQCHQSINPNALLCVYVYVLLLISFDIDKVRPKSDTKVKVMGKKRDTLSQKVSTFVAMRKIIPGR